jgi:hypothetical protein
MGFIEHAEDRVQSSFEHISGRIGSIKGRKYVGQHNCYNLLEKDSASWS